MDLIKNDKVTEESSEYNEIENKLNELSQGNNEEPANGKETEFIEFRTEEEISDDEDDIANLIADLYMSGPPIFPKSKQDQEILSEYFPLPNNTLSDMDQVIGNLEAIPEEEEVAIIDHLLEELNHRAVGFIQDNQIPGL